MSKISEQKALEAYPEDYAYVKCDNEDTNYTEIDDEGTKWLKVDFNKEFRTVYTKCYDQAMQDFKELIYDKFNIHPHDCHVVQYDSDTPLESMDDFVKQIETYIENEL